MPTQWANTLNHALEVWLPCEHNIAAFREGVARPLFKLPHAYRPPASQPWEPGALHDFLRLAPDDFLIYSIFEWQERKTPLGQLMAYFRAFPRPNGQVLLLKVNPGAAAAADAALQEARRATGSYARVEIRPEAWTGEQIDALHQRGDCYLSLHRGEGWCYPLFDAVCRGTPAVATGYSGPLEYLDPQAHELVRYKLAPVRQRYLYYHPRMRWAEPDEEHAADRLRWVYENREHAAARARSAAARLRSEYAPERIGEMAKQRLLAIRGRSLAHRTISVAVPKDSPEPPVPIPGEWYDAGYFEHGTRSNWSGGYQWRHFQGLFRDAADFLIATFPTAASFLDAGCAKGFLVRALREKQKDAWGFDISAFAVGQSGDAAPYLRIAGVDDVAYDRSFDVLIALDLFSHLTEEQAVRFLERARGWTSVGLLATIACAGDFSPNDRDRTHITRRERSWWHELIVSHGWCQDPLHRAFQQACQRHPLPSAMRWNVFLYSSGGQ